LKDISEDLIAEISQKSGFLNLGFASSTEAKTLTFAENERFLNIALENPNIVSILTTKELFFTSSGKGKLFICTDPQAIFFGIHNQFGRESVPRAPSKIHETAVIAGSAIIAQHNVEIGPNVFIGEGCIVNEGVTISSDCNIQSGCVLGADAIYVVKSIEGSRFLAKHYGTTYIGERVDIGANTVVDKGIFPYEETKIGAGTFIGPLSNLSHGVEVGINNSIASGVNIAGYTKIGNNNWMGPSVTISHRIEIGSDNYISLGSVLLRSIENKTKVVGNKIFSDRKLF
jgi:UDP-3-O-[3-hydroxymyristoyl] glucosamine N-acyltransferase